MLTPPSSLRRFGPEWEDLLFHFEAAWNEGPPEELRRFCPAQATTAFILELLRIDVARRQGAGLPLPFTNYLKVFPEIAEELPHAAHWHTLLGSPTLPFDAAAPTLDFRVAGEELDASDLARPITVTAAYGNFRLHAQGGLGEVYVAEDTQLHRPVALKLLQERWYASRRACHSFLREAEITSKLEHPGIVPVHGIGTSPAGRPCYSMRFVEGETLRAAIDRFHHEPPSDPSRRTLAQRELLTRFVAVCNTIAYAHSKGVIHRDLKPENILLGTFGETLVVDWGLAKEIAATPVATTAGGAEPLPAEALQSPATEETQPGDVIGTPAYLSPEQALGGKAEIGPATDIFGLGACLYAILTGGPPYQESSVALVVRKARLAEFAAPRVRRPGTPAGLDAICRKAMQREPAARYGSAQDLARDVENWLAGERVTAWLEPWHVTARRALRRRPFLLGAVAVAAVLVPLALAVGGWFIAAERAERELARRTAEAQRAAAAQTALYLVRTFESAEPVGLGPVGFQFGETQLDKTLQRMLIQGHELLASQLHDQPLLRARLLIAIGNTHLTLGEADEARARLREAYELRRTQLGPQAVDTLQSLHWLARLEHDTGYYDEARLLYEEVLRGREKLVPAQPLLVAESKFYLGWLTFDQPLGITMPQFNGQTSAAAEKLLLEALRIREWCLPPSHRDLGHTYGVLATLKACQTNQEAAAAEYRNRALAIFRQEPDYRYAEYLCKYLQAEEDRKCLRFDKVVPVYEEMLTYLQRQLGPRHPRVMLQMANMVGLYRKAYFSPRDPIRRLHCLARGLTLMRELRLLVRDNRLMRSQPLFVDALRQYGDYFRLVEKNENEAVAVYQEALRHARERPDANQASLQTLAQRLSETPLATTATAR